MKVFRAYSSPIVPGVYILPNKPKLSKAKFIKISGIGAEFYASHCTKQKHCWIYVFLPGLVLFFRKIIHPWIVPNPINLKNINLILIQFFIRNGVPLTI